jgi:hypothetical protein
MTSMSCTLRMMSKFSRLWRWFDEGMKWRLFGPHRMGGLKKYGYDRVSL